MMPTSAFPTLPIQLPENSPIRTFVLSVDFDSQSLLSQPDFQIQYASTNENLPFSFLEVETRYNTVLIRTNSSLHGIATTHKSDSSIMEFVLFGNHIEMGRFSVQILPVFNCQPHFTTTGQQLNLQVNQVNNLNLILITNYLF